MSFELKKLAIQLRTSINVRVLEQGVLVGEQTRQRVEEEHLSTLPSSIADSLLLQWNHRIGPRLQTWARWHQRHKPGKPILVDAENLPSHSGGINHPLLTHHSGRETTIEESLGSLYFRGKETMKRIHHATSVSEQLSNFVVKTSYLSLNDTPASYVQASDHVIVNSNGQIGWGRPPSNARIVDLPDTPSAYPNRQSWIVTATDTQFFFQNKAEMQRWQFTSISWTAVSGNLWNLSGTELNGYMVLMNIGSNLEADDFIIELGPIGHNARIGFKVINGEPGLTKELQADSMAGVTFDEGQSPQMYPLDNGRAHVFQYSTEYSTYYRTHGVF